MPGSAVGRSSSRGGGGSGWPVGQRPTRGQQKGRLRVLVGSASFSPRLSRPEKEKAEEWAELTKGWGNFEVFRTLSNSF